MSAPTDRVLIAGAGASTLVTTLAAAGYSSLIAVDISDVALEQLSRRLEAESVHMPPVQMIVADIADLVLEEPVDVWHDRAVFHFLTVPEDQARYAQVARAAVRPGGWLIIATFAPGGPEQCSGLSVARHDAESLATVFGGGFELTESFEHDHVTPWGSVQLFTFAVFRRLEG